jgi:hypothetical protein
MIAVPVPVETHTFDANTYRLLGYRFANRLGRSLITAFVCLHTQILRPCTRRSKRRRGIIIYYLGIDMPVGAENRKPWPLRRAKNLLSRSCLLERKTESLGRSGVPKIFFLARNLRLILAFFTFSECTKTNSQISIKVN